MNNVDVIILAGGKGARMNSALAKPLHVVGGKPAITRILESASPICKKPIIVVGDRREEVMRVLGERPRYVYQKERQGTGHAVLTAKKMLGQYPWSEHVMVLPGDHPLMTTRTLSLMLETHQASNAVISVSTLTTPDFEGDNQSFMQYGRVRRDRNGRLDSIIELKDATEREKEIKEVNVGYYCFKTEWLWNNIGALTTKNAARELYLTDMVGIAASQKILIGSYAVKNRIEALGFNTQEQLDIIRRLFSSAHSPE